MKCFYTDKPSGTFFAVYSDLSAAFLFTQTENGNFIDCFGNDFEGEVDSDWFQDAGYLWFFNVDDTFAKQAQTFMRGTK